MLNKDLELILNVVFCEVRMCWYEFMIVEYFLFVLFDNFFVGEVLNVCGVDMGVLKVELLEFIDEIMFVIFDFEEDREI